MKIGLSPQFKGSSLKPTLPKLSNRERVATKSVPDTKVWSKCGWNISDWCKIRKEFLNLFWSFVKQSIRNTKKSSFFCPNEMTLGMPSLLLIWYLSKDDDVFFWISFFFFREESPYYDLMQNIVKIIKMGLYFNTELLNRSDRLWEKLDSQLLSNSLAMLFIS